MSTFLIIQQKLEQFIKKYYTNSLIKGVILFFAIGLLYLLITLLVEHFLWLDTTGRTILFWAFVVVELSLFVRFIAFPLAKLFKLQQGIDSVAASKIIGSHFPEVSDKLLNVIQLNQNRRESELLAASIDQKAAQLEPIPFKNAISYATNAKYLKYAAIPLAVFIIGTLVGDKNLFSSSYKRVVNYDTAYEPPAPFSFFIENENLEAIEFKNFTLRVATVGELVPESPSIEFNDQTYFLKEVGPGLFEYTFAQPTEDLEFSLAANTVRSRPYQLTVVKVPTLVAMQMVMDYPAYTGKKDEVIANTGNATVPEGTQIGWQLSTKQTLDAAIKLKDTVLAFAKNGSDFTLQRRLYSDFDYAITTSNEALKEYENLSFKIDVVKDNYPSIELQSKVDSTDAQITYFLGRISDDYGLSKLQLVYYPSGEEDKKAAEPLVLNKGVFDQFTYAFPADLPLEKGVAYEYYFEVFDNDVIHNYKSSKSGVYSFRMLTDDEEESKQLEQQQNSIEGLDESLEKLKEREALLKELSKLQKEKASLNWNDKKKIENFIKRQKQQEEMMKNFSKQMEQNLDNFEKEEDDPYKEQLQERLKETQEDLDKNEELLKELEELQEKIKKEELTEMLEKLAKNNKNQERNLEQLLELTKRYYVSKKTEKIAEELQKLGEKQEKLADAPEDENTKEAQEELNEAFQELKEQLKELREENEELKEPMDIMQDKTGEKMVEQEQQKATEKLEQQQPQQAGENQKKAGEKMKQMGSQMSQQMSGSSMEAMEEDLDMLRQILDNLVVFSFEQEDLMQDFREIDYNSPGFSTKLKLQNTLKQHFEHIDDSLFSLASRQPMIGREINELLTDVEFNIDKSLERLAENRVMMGITSQQYTVTGANDLAVLLSNALGNMQNMMMGTGKGSGGQGQGFQLPDIIKQQESLNEQMEQGTKGKKGKQPGEGEGEGQGEGEGEGEGQGEGEGEGEGEGQGEGDGNGNSNGSSEGSGGESNGESEDSNGDLYRIYQEQQMLRQQLQDKMSEEGLNGAGGDLLRKMEDIEQELLDKGFNERTLQKMTELKYEMLKLDEATFDQGEEQRRESRTNKNQFTNPLGPNSLEIKKLFNTTEILNRESLPMRSKYKRKVQEYFKNKND